MSVIWIDVHQPSVHAELRVVIAGAEFELYFLSLHIRIVDHLSSTQVALKNPLALPGKQQLILH